MIGYGMVFIRKMCVRNFSALKWFIKVIYVQNLDLNNVPGAGATAFRMGQR